MLVSNLRPFSLPYCSQVHRAIALFFTHLPMLNLSQLIMDKRDRVEKEKVLAQYVVDSLNTHNFWAFKVILRVLNDP